MSSESSYSGDLLQDETENIFKEGYYPVLSGNPKNKAMQRVLAEKLSEGENGINQGIDSGINSGTSEKNSLWQRKEETPKVPTRGDTKGENQEPFGFSSISFPLKPVNNLQQFECALPKQDTGRGVINNWKVQRSLEDPLLQITPLLNRENIYLCYSRCEDCTFVIKLIPYEDYLKRRQELQVPLSNQAFPWMIKIFGIAKLKKGYRDYVAIFMEYVSGKSLDQSIIPWSEDKVTKFVINMLHILEDLKTLDIVHGDIKAENICLRQPNDVESSTLIDWESAKNPMFKLNFRGTQYYCPPWLKDITRNKWNELQSMDLWAVGILACFLATGRLPWTDLKSSPRNVVEYIQKHPEEIENYYPATEGPLAKLIQGILPKSGKLSDQISIEECLHILEDQGKNLTVKFRGETFTNIPCGLKFKDILAIRRIQRKIQQIKIQESCFQHGVSTWLKTDGKLVFLHGSQKMKNDFEMDITPPT